jgi:hypothetical protein
MKITKKQLREIIKEEIQRLGRVDEATKVKYKHILMVRNEFGEEFTVAAFPAQGDANIALQAFKKIAPKNMEYYLTKK